MSRPPSAETFMVKLRHVDLRINWKKDWFNAGVAHLEIICITEGAILPVTQTGYRSHFLDQDDVVKRGGPVAYVMAWLDAEAASPELQRRDAASRQLKLF